jgi:phage-related baseplate assembly protein
MKLKGNNRGLVLAGVLLVAAMAVMLTIYFIAKPGTDNGQGKKRITVHVIIPDEDTKIHEIETDAAYLRQALDERALIEGSESTYGFFITGVDGRIADVSKEEWWCITKKGEEVFYGIDAIALEDGDQYELTLKAGY